MIRARQRGTTVAELLAGTAILATLLGTTVVTSSEVRPLYVLRGAVREVAADLQKARMSAATENNRYKVQLTGAHTYSIHDDDNNNGVVDVGEKVQTVDAQLDWSGVTLSAPGSITFLPDGTVLAPVVITVQKSGTTAKTISISQAGSIRIQ